MVDFAHRLLYAFLSTISMKHAIKKLTFRAPICSSFFCMTGLNIVEKKVGVF